MADGCCPEMTGRWMRRELGQDKCSQLPGKRVFKQLVLKMGSRVSQTLRQQEAQVT